MWVDIELDELEYVEFKKIATEMERFIEKHFDAHTEVNIRVGEVTVKQDILNSFLK